MLIMHFDFIIKRYGNCQYGSWNLDLLENLYQRTNDNNLDKVLRLNFLLGLLMRISNAVSWTVVMDGVTLG